jgi:hypothetical protein
LKQSTLKTIYHFFAILRDCNQCIGKHLCIAVSLNLSLFLCLQINLCLLVWLCMSFHISRSLSLCLSLTQFINVSTVQNKLKKGLISREIIFKMALTPPFLRMYCFVGFSLNLLKQKILPMVNG